MVFPEEQLDSPVGYFPAKIGQQLQDGRWRIVRKLGWGSRSSTWMAIHKKKKYYVALKIFTVAATEDGSAFNEQEFLYLLQDLSTNVARIRQHFREKSPRGEHLCLALHSLTFSVETFRLRNTEEGGYLPLHTVRKILSDILSVLSGLGRKGIIHGAVLPDNFLFWSIEAEEDINPELARNPCHKMVEVAGSDGKMYHTVPSQPMPQGFKWDDTPEYIADANIYLSNFSHARLMTEPAPFKAPPNFLPPEVLLGRKLNCSVNTWMLGCSAYLLATGTPLLSDSYTASPLKVLNETLLRLEELLQQNGKVSGKDVPAFAAVLRLFLASDPAKRATVAELYENKWIYPY